MVFGILLVLGLFLVSCQQKTVCNKPYILVGNSCCLDKNDNKVCDNEEESKKEKIGIQQLANITKSVIDKEELAKLTASKFARLWEQEDYSPMYEYFIDDLKKLKSKERFIEAAKKQVRKESITIRLDNVELENETTAFAYYTFSTILVDTKAPAMQMLWDGKSWKVDAFWDRFTLCDKYMTNCCGNEKCENKEFTALYEERCPQDCHTLQINSDLATKEYDKSFLGESYNIKRSSLSKNSDNEYILNLNINGVDLGELKQGDQKLVTNNIYIKFYYSDYNNGIVMTLFNKD